MYHVKEKVMFSVSFLEFRTCKKHYLNDTVQQQT